MTTTVLPKIFRASIPWYNGWTDKVLRGVQVGKMISIKTESAHGESRRSVRIDTEPITRLAYHANVGWSIFHRNEWLEFQFAFGVLVYDQNEDNRRIMQSQHEPVRVESYPGLGI
jgi:hypothetical protein